MANIILANISILRKELNEIEYKLKFSNHSKETITACHTNESVLKAFAEYHPIQETGGVHKIIALVSQKVLNEQHIQINKTAFEYISDCAQALWPNVEIYPINIEDDQFNELSTQSILEQVCNHITTNDKVYIDCAGGMRTTSNVIQIMTKLLQYKGIENPLSLYSNVQNKYSFIDDNTSFEKMTYLADAFNEFMTTGKSDLLNHYVPTQEHPQLSNLLKTMQAFSNAIRILDIDHLDDIIGNLQNSIRNCENIERKDTIESVIIHQFLPVIKNKLLGNQNCLDYLSIIQWCLDNALIQQALTIFESKIPKYLFDKRLIEYRSNSIRIQVESEANKSTLHFSTEAYALYTDLLLNITHDPMISELTEWINNGTQVQTPIVKEAVALIKSFEAYFKSRTTPHHLSVIGQKVFDLIKNKKYKSYENFKKDIGNNKKILQAILHLKDEEESSKIEAIAAIQQGKEHGRYKINDHRQFAIILYAYAFLKQERNRINHATSEKLKDFTEYEKEILQNNGFEIINHISYYSTLCKNIQYAIDSVRNATPEQSITIETTFTPTKLQLGDEVLATCSSNKKVYIDSEDYEIQMVIPKEIGLKQGFDNLLGMRIQVRVKQISKAGKIAQVEFIQIIKQ